MIFPKPGRYYFKHLRKGSSYLDLLKRTSSRAGDGGFRKIVIPDNLELTQEEFTLLLKASPSLELLEVLCVKDLSFPPEEKIWNQLRHVTLGCCDNTLDPIAVDLPRQFPCRFLQNVASSLEHLTFSGVPEQWYTSEPVIPHLPKLKYLHLGGWYDGQTPFSMFPLAIAFPRIEQLWMGPDLPNLNLGPVALWRDKWEGVWPHLKVLIFDASGAEDIEELHVSGLRHLMCLNRGNSLLHLVLIQFYLDWSDEIRDIFGHRQDELAHFDVARHSDFRNLRSVTSHDGIWIFPDRARTLLSSSIENKQLASFDIVFPRRVLTSLTENSSVHHLRGYDWLRGAPSIHTLGFFDFLFPLNPKNDEDLPLPQFLATFPNLRTLRLNDVYYREHENEFASLILAVMSVTRLKTILICRYYSHSDNKAMIKVMEEAQFKGVQIFTGAKYWVEQWPIPLGS
ncbi:hypothetical protein E4U11_007735 [Claviceps purpurea]|nr:hypothetical protein E4U11_007735 [Claviceps purpurea]